MIKLNKKIICFSLTLFVFLNIGQAQYLAKFQQANNLINNFQFSEAEKELQQFRNRQYLKPFITYFNLKINFYKYIVIKDETIYNRIMAISEDLISNTEIEEAEVRYLIGSAFTIRTIIQIFNLQYKDAFWQARKANNVHSDLLKENFMISNLDMAFINYSTLHIKDWPQIIIKLMGFDQDKNKIFEHLEKVQKPENFYLQETRFFYALLLAEVNRDFQKAGQILSDLATLFPNNPIVLYSLAKTKITEYSLKDAKLLLSNIIVKSNKEYNNILAFAYFLLGDISLKENEIELAAVNYEKFKELTKDIKYSGEVNYRLALIYSKLNKTRDAEYCLLKAKENKSDTENDEFAKRRSKLINKNLKNQDLINLLISEINIDGLQIKAAEKNLKDINYKKLSNEFKAVYNYQKAYISFYNENYHTASEFLENVIKNRVKSEKWILTKSYILQAKIKRIVAKIAESKFFIEKAEDSNNGDFSRTFQNEIEQLKNSYFRQN